ncbi:MAG TPA: hypothetical protein VK348_15285, partial [Planctomycetota bacterium]|nr:hypothetical protein [Planctomycetota bacterium]
LPPAHPLRLALQRELFALANARAERAEPASRLPLLRTARELAPDQSDWLQVQYEVLEALAGDPAAVLVELEAMAAHAGAAAHAFPDTGGRVPVAAWVLWHKAGLLHGEPALLAWQQLLEEHADVAFGSLNAGDVAAHAIGALLEQGGDQLYAAVEARAAAAFAQARDDTATLRSLCQRFPHSKAAVAASMHLADLAVEQGGLTAVIAVLARSLQSGQVPPGILRRTMIAAERAGNHGLAQAVAERLLPHAAERSDWPADHGATYGSLLTAAGSAPPAAAAVAVPAPPNQLLFKIATGHGRSFRLVETLQPPGFAAPADVPLYVLQYDNQSPEAMLVAFDLVAGGERKRELWKRKVSFLDHVVLCGNVLVLPDVGQVTAIDYRAGTPCWEWPNPHQHIIDFLGVQSGVMQLLTQRSVADDGATFLGIEPLSGAVLFQHPLGRAASRPKAVLGQLLLLDNAATGDASVHRLDPVTGATVSTVALEQRTLQQLGLRPDALKDPLFPQDLDADRARIFLPANPQTADGRPQVAAIGNDGVVQWQWRGGAGRRLHLAARRDQRFVVVESNPKRGGHAAVLDATTGAVVRELDLGEDVQPPLNCQRGWMPTPAPALLLLCDRAGERGTATRRLSCLAVADGLPSFQFGLAADDGEGIQQPVLGPDFVTFAVRPTARHQLRLYCLRLQDRSGGLADGKRNVSWQLDAPYGVTAVGPYTVVAG